MTAMRRSGRRRGWAIVALAVLVGTGTAAWRWFAPLTDRLAEARRAYQKGEWSRGRASRPGGGSGVPTMTSRPCASMRGHRSVEIAMRWATRSTRIGLAPNGCSPKTISWWARRCARLGRDETAIQVWEKAADSRPRSSRAAREPGPAALELGRPIGPTPCAAADAPARMGSTRLAPAGRGAAPAR